MKLRERIARWLMGKAGSNQFIQALTARTLVGQPAAWADDPKEQVKHYKHWVFAAVRAIANRVAATPLSLYKRTKGGEAEEVDDPNHPFVHLLEFVNPFHTQFWLWSQTITFLQMTGNAYWYLPKSGLGIPGEIWVAHSQFMKVMPDKQKFIGGYEYNRGGVASKAVKFKPDEVVHLKLPNPESLYYGRGPLQAAAETVDAHEAMKTVQFNMMKGGAFPGGAITAEGELSDEQKQRLKTQFQQKYAGEDKAGKWMILDDGIKAEPLTLTPQEMAFMESTNMNRAELLSIFGVPEAILGRSETVNRAVANAMDMIFARYTIMPLLQLIAAQLNQDLLPRYDPKLFVEFDSAVPEDQEQTNKAVIGQFNAGLVTQNEARAELGHEEVKGGNIFYMPMAQVPVGGEDYDEEAGGEEEPTPPAEPPPEEGKAGRLQGRKAARPETRTWYKAAFVREQQHQERRMTRGMQRFFGGQGRRVVNALKREVGVKAIEQKYMPPERLTERIFHERLEAERMMRAAMPHIQGTLKFGGDRTYESIGMGGEMFDLDSPEARRWLKGKDVAYWKSDAAPNATTIRKIHTTLAAGMSAGETPYDLVNRVKDVFTMAKASRAKLISRTETVGAYNGGGEVVRDQLAAKKIKTIKIWFTTLDDKTRDDHVPMNNVEVPHKQPFIVGGERLNYPGDPAGSPAQVCNCRCAAGTEVVEET